MPFDKTAYMREYMRRWREKRRQERGELLKTQEVHAACDLKIKELEREVVRLKVLLRQHGVPY